MLSFARKGDGRKTVQDLPGLIDASLDLVRKDGGLQKNRCVADMRVVREFEPDLPRVPCEAAKIQQVLINLVRNSIDAFAGVPPGSRDLEIRFGLGREGSRVRLEVGDNGPGMDENTCRRVFEPFFTTRGSTGGTGLGLSISYFIVTDDHGGEMSVVSAPGEGTRFIIRLPLQGD
jgi:signal transduction histidine kinase